MSNKAVISSRRAEPAKAECIKFITQSDCARGTRALTCGLKLVVQTVATEGASCRPISLTVNSRSLWMTYTSLANGSVYGCLRPSWPGDAPGRCSTGIESEYAQRISHYAHAWAVHGLKLCTLVAAARFFNYCACRIEQP